MRDRGIVGVQERTGKDGKEKIMSLLTASNSNALNAEVDRLYRT
jgi:hypothetical protein